MNASLQTLAPSALLGLLSVGFVLVWFYTLWQRYVIDQTRQRLFELRDQWFDTCAAAGALQTRGARFVREVLNGEIRFAHRMTLPSALLYLLTGRNKNVEKTIAAAMVSAMETLDPSLRSAAQSVLRSASWHVTSAVIRRSLIAIMMIPVAAVAAAIAFVVSAPSGVLQHNVNRDFNSVLKSELAFAAAGDRGISALLAVVH
ncbi:MAG: hypothetical protein ACYCST_02205 [Acidimicrobiales bacterium]